MTYGRFVLHFLIGPREPAGTTCKNQAKFRLSRSAVIHWACVVCIEVSQSRMFDATVLMLFIHYKEDLKLICRSIFDPFMLTIKVSDINHVRFTIKNFSLQIDQYAPGFPLKIQEFSISLWNGLCSSSAYAYHSSCDFFKTKVFV